MIALEYQPEDLKMCMLLVQYIEENVMDKLNLIEKVQLVLFHPWFASNRSAQPEAHTRYPTSSGRTRCQLLQLIVAN
jgi:hypothetical protein